MPIYIGRIGPSFVASALRTNNNCAIDSRPCAGVVVEKGTEYHLVTGEDDWEAAARANSVSQLFVSEVSFDRRWAARAGSHD